MEEACACGLSMQLPYRMDAEIQVPDSRRRNSEKSRREDTSNLRMERCRNHGTQRNERPCAYGGEHATEGIDIRADGDTEREDSNCAVQRQAGAQKEAVLGELFLEPGILCHDNRDGRRKDTAICEIPGRERTDRGE